MRIWSVGSEGVGPSKTFDNGFHASRGLTAWGLFKTSHMAWTSLTGCPPSSLTSTLCKMSMWASKSLNSRGTASFIAIFNALFISISICKKSQVQAIMHHKVCLVCSDIVGGGRGSSTHLPLRWTHAGNRFLLAVPYIARLKIASQTQTQTQTLSRPRTIPGPPARSEAAP